MKSLLPSLSPKAYNQDHHKTLEILFYELGKVTEYGLKSEIYGTTGLNAYYSDSNQKKEVSDAITMLRLYCEQKYWDFEELLVLGEEGFLDRQKDLDNYAK